MHRFTARPMRLYVAADAPEDCIAALERNVLWYRERNTTLILDRVDAFNPALNGFVVGGVVGIVIGKLDDNVRGATRIALTPGDAIYAAEITLAFCDDLTVTHEAGHALGLEHVAATGNLMYKATDRGGWNLTDAQLDWIGDETLGTIISYSTTESLRWESLQNTVVIECRDDE